MDNQASSIGFTPATVTAPRYPLKRLQALGAAIRNPIELWDEEIFTKPFRIIERLGGKVMEIADPDLAHAVLVREADAFTRSEFQLRFTRPLVGDGILAARGESWRMQRRASAPCFRKQALDLLVPSVAHAAQSAVRAIADARFGGDVMPVMMNATFEVLAGLMGVRAEALDACEIERAANDYLGGVGLSAVAQIFGFGRLHRALPLQSNRAIRTMRVQAQCAVSEAGRGEAHEQLIGRLRRAFVDQERSETRLRDSVIAFIASGVETAAVGLGWALWLIANDEVVQARLAEEADAVLGADGRIDVERLDRLVTHASVIKEALRLFPPIPLMQRTVLRPVRIGDVDLGPGDEVVCAIYVMHRSPRVWDRPAVFDPDRFDSARGCHRFSSMPFGAGQHACLGMPLALMEMTAILAAITRTFEIQPDSRRSPEPVMRLTLRPKHGVHLKFVEREKRYGGAGPGSGGRRRAHVSAAHS